MGRFQRELESVVRPERAARLIAGDVTRRRLQGPSWRRVSQGLYLSAGSTVRSPTQRIVEAAARVPRNAVIAGWAAAFAVGTDSLDGLDPFTMAEQPVTVCLPPGLHRAPLPGVRYVRDRLEDDEVTVVSTFRVTSRARTALDLARWAPDLTEAVAALDAMPQYRTVRTAQLRAATAKLPGRRGAVQARRAVTLCRTGARSTWESRLRMVYVLDLQLPSPLVNPAIFDDRERFLGYADLLDEEAGLVMEYDGATWSGAAITGGHRDRLQHG